MLYLVVAYNKIKKSMNYRMLYNYPDLSSHKYMYRDWILLGVYIFYNKRFIDYELYRIKNSSWHYNRGKWT